MLAGWTTTEVGRQPWTVYGVLRTAQSVTPSLTGVDVLISLLGYIAVYLHHVPDRPVVRAAHRARRRGAERNHARGSGGRPAAPVKPVPGAMIIFDFVPIWTLILGLAVFFYVLLDGFDLGVGILYNFARTTRRPQSDDEFHRSDLGRQRDLAGAGRHRPAGGLSRWPSPSSCPRSISRSW